MTTGPYASAALSYWQVGWRGIVPLPAKAKKYPPKGYTGEGGADPSYADIFTWATDPASDRGGGNIALRMPRDVIGLDVDNYGDKTGGLVIAAREAEWGELPPTWRSTSRDDGVSGIRLYRVPEGLAWPGELGESVEILQHKHRYAIVCPSVHPEGRTYRWLNPAGVVSTALPDPDELPALPDTWIEGITRGELAGATTRNNLSPSDTTAWLVTLPYAMDAPCARMRKAVEQVPAAMRGSAHSAARDGALRVIRLASEGHAGVVTALAETRRLFFTEATRADRELLGKARRSDAQATREWDDLVSSAVNLVTGEPSEAQTCDCDGQITSSVLTAALRVDGSAALAPHVEPAPAPSPTEQEKAPAEAPSRLKDGAQFILDAPAEIPAVWGAGDEVLWAQGEALMLVGPPGVGKTTICGQIVRARLGLGGDVLGYPVQTAGRRVLYLAMDRPQQISRALRRLFSEADRAVLADRLRVWEGPPPGDIAKNTGVILALAELADADTVIVDSLKDAAVGLTDDEIAAGYNRARQTALAAGVQVAELHHLVKRGPNGSKPNTLADVYGSMHITSGAGSVVLLWGAAGDPIVQLSHLKQPLVEVGPIRLLHNHTTGTTSVFHNVDPVALCAVTPAGITARDLARAIAETDEPEPNEIEKARRKLNNLVRDGVLDKHDEVTSGSLTTTRYRLHAPTRTPTDPTPRDTPRAHTVNSKTAGQSPHGQPHAPHAPDAGATPRFPPPSLEGGERGVGGVTVNKKTGEILDDPDDPDDDTGLRWDQR